MPEDMPGDLRAAIPKALEQLAGDVLIGRYDDPHVGFVVLVYPDKEATVVALTDGRSGAYPLASLVTRDDKNAAGRKRGGRFFTVDDLVEAKTALSDAVQAMRGFGWKRRENPELSLGEHIVSEMARLWHWRRESALDRAMEKAAHDARYAFKCEICGSGFTERGLKMHQKRAPYCSRRLAESSTESSARSVGGTEHE